MRSFSKTFNIPLKDKSFQSQQLLQTMHEIAQRQQELMAQKLMRQEEIQNRLRQLQTSYQIETHKKSQKIKSKLEKSQKNRLQFLDKIVKRCKDKQKLFNQKIKSTTSKRKQSLRQAWKVATQFNQKILQGKNIRHTSFDRENKKPQSNQQENLNKSVLIPDYVNQESKVLVAIQPPVTSKRSNSKPIESSLGNRSLLKPYDQGMFQSTFNIDRKLEKISKPTNINTGMIQKNITTEQNPQSDYQQKLRRTLVRHQQFMMEEQNKKIQEYGQRLAKINLSRRKKDELHKSRLKKSNIDSEQGYDDDQIHRKQDKLNKKQNQRIKSQSQSCHRVKRVSDWALLNKQRRQQLLNAHVESGNQYLSQNKIRYLKQIMSRSIAYDALEKKLYQQRIRHS